MMLAMEMMEMMMMSYWAVNEENENPTNENGAGGYCLYRSHAVQINPP